MSTLQLSHISKRALAGGVRKTTSSTIRCPQAALISTKSTPNEVYNTFEAEKPEHWYKNVNYALPVIGLTIAVLSLDVLYKSQEMRHGPLSDVTQTQGDRNIVAMMEERSRKLTKLVKE